MDRHGAKRGEAPFDRRGRPPGHEADDGCLSWRQAVLDLVEKVAASENAPHVEEDPQVQPEEQANDESGLASPRSHDPAEAETDDRSKWPRDGWLAPRSGPVALPVHEN